ncbi:MAG: AAA family ATPase, partial [Acidimicrobiales bacterium]
METNEIPEGTVTVLFSDLVESTTLNQTLGDDRAREVARQIETVARSLIDAHRGILIKEMGDGVMAAFASARRAVACAREMQVEMRRLQRGGLGEAVAMRIGLHTGEVIAEDGDIHGETVIIASRIEGLAPPNGVLASDTVHGVLGTARDELVDQGEANLKGIDAPWRLWLVPVADDAETDALSDTDLTPYVGRASERERLRTMVEDAAGGRGGIVFLGGEAGSGKSRLAREMAVEAQRHSMTVRVGHCLDMESPPSYQPVIDQLEHAARGLTPEAFRSALGVNAPEIARLMPALRQRYDDIPEPPDLSPDQERRYMLHGVGEFIERTSTAQPVVLVYEDLHWADESTMLLIRQLAQRVADLPVLIVGTYRSNELDPDRPLATNLPPLRRDHGAVDLLLQPLSRTEVGAVIEARAGQAPPDDLLQLIYTESDGNPFFVEEVYKHLRDSGKLFDDDGGWKPDIAVGETEVPRNVLLVIGRRLDQLDTAVRRSLCMAAVIGRRFDFDLLLSVSGEDEDDLLDALEAAERMNLISEDEDEAGYVFVHEQIRQALVGDLSLARRQRAHLKVAGVLEDHPNPSAV